MSQMSNDRPTQAGVETYLLWILFGGMGLAVLIVALWAVGWMATPFRITNPERVEMLSRQANDAWQALEAQEASIASQKKALDQYTDLYGDDMAKWPQGKRQEYQQGMVAYSNLVNAYNRSCSQYNAMWQDEWRSIPAPDDLPTRCELVQ